MNKEQLKNIKTLKEIAEHLNSGIFDIDEDYAIQSGWFTNMQLLTNVDELIEHIENKESK